MPAPRPSKKQIAVISLTTAIFLIGAYWVTMWSFHYSSSTQFCTSCHEMVEPYNQYKASIHYKNDSGVIAECADCHLPPGAFSKWYAKISQGVNDTIKHVLLNPEDIDHEKWKAVSMKKIRSEACLKCHKNLLPPDLPRGGLIAHRAFLKGEIKPTCLQCHENLVHVSHK